MAGNDDARAHLAVEAARLSEAMLHAARENLWDEVEEMRARRDAAVYGIFEAPPSNAPAWAEDARKAQALNGALAELAARERERLLRELTALHQGLKAQSAYGEFLDD
jgi:hypothetical protein